MAQSGADLNDQLCKKKQFFSDLDAALGDEDDATPPPGHQAATRALKEGGARKHDSLATGDKGSRGLLLSASDNGLAKTNKQEGRSSVGGISTPTSTGARKLPLSFAAQDRTSSTSSKAATTMALSSSSTSKTTGKRKRGSDIRLVPLDRQIFKGLHFYFFPNNDTHPARRMRITKALELGATWQKEWNESVTHVICDKAMDYSLLLKFLKIDSIPKEVAVLSEDYPAECMSYRMLLDPNQRRFKVKGCESAPTTRSMGLDLDSSPQTKRANKSTATPEPIMWETNKRVPSPSDGGIENEDDHTAQRPPKPASAKSIQIQTMQSTEEFDAAIRQVKELQNVPLDADDESTSRPTSSDGQSRDDNKRHRDSSPKMQKNTPNTWQEKFQCMQKHVGPGISNPNSATISILQQMADYYAQMGDEWRTRAYRKAIASLRSHPQKIGTKQEALALPQIGERLAAKIEEIAFTNRLQRLDNARAEPRDQILQTFSKVYGAGFVQASKWVATGYTTLDELLKTASLTDNQRIGIEHYVDFNSRIPRAEVEQHGAVVRETLREIEPGFEVIIGGSYRRGADTSGDVDCIITHPDAGISHIRHVIIERLIPRLRATGFLVAELAATSREDGSKWHGASRLPSSSLSNPWRRIDLLLVPAEEMGAAMIYFTGNDIFNRSLRLLARKKGMRLNQRGLYKDVIRGKGGERLGEGSLVEGRDERAIFETLGVPWRPPEHRIC